MSRKMDDGDRLSGAVTESHGEHPEDRESEEELKRASKAGETAVNNVGCVEVVRNREKLHANSLSRIVPDSAQVISMPRRDLMRWARVCNAAGAK